MVDKTDIADLLPTLQRLCLEHRAISVLLDEEPVEYWRATVSRFGSAPKAIQDVREQFHAVYDSLVSIEDDDLLIPKLKDALNKTGL
jgi:hypothetical protein